MTSAESPVRIGQVEVVNARWARDPLAEPVAHTDTTEPFPSTTEIRRLHPGANVLT